MVMVSMEGLLCWRLVVLAELADKEAKLILACPAATLGEPVVGGDPAAITCGLSEFPKSEALV